MNTKKKLMTTIVQKDLTVATAAAMIVVAPDVFLVVPAIIVNLVID